MATGTPELVAGLAESILAAADAEREAKLQSTPTIAAWVASGEVAETLRRAKVRGLSWERIAEMAGERLGRRVSPLTIKTYVYPPRAPKAKAQTCGNAATSAAKPMRADLPTPIAAPADTGTGGETVMIMGVSLKRPPPPKPPQAWEDQSNW